MKNSDGKDGQEMKLKRNLKILHWLAATVRKLDKFVSMFEVHMVSDSDLPQVPNLSQLLPGVSTPLNPYAPEFIPATLGNATNFGGLFGERGELNNYSGEGAGSEGHDTSKGKEQAKFKGEEEPINHKNEGRSNSEEFYGDREELNNCTGEGFDGEGFDYYKGRELTNFQGEELSNCESGSPTNFEGLYGERENLSSYTGEALSSEGFSDSKGEEQAKFEGEERTNFQGGEQTNLEGPVGERGELNDSTGEGLGSEGLDNYRGEEHTNFEGGEPTGYEGREQSDHYKGLLVIIRDAMLEGTDPASALAAGWRRMSEVEKSRLNEEHPEFMQYIWEGAAQTLEEPEEEVRKEKQQKKNKEVEDGNDGSAVTAGAPAESSSCSSKLAPICQRGMAGNSQKPPRPHGKGPRGGDGGRQKHRQGLQKGSDGKYKTDSDR